MIAYFTRLNVTEAYKQLCMPRSTFDRRRNEQNPAIPFPPNLEESSTANAKFYAGHFRDYQQSLVTGKLPKYIMPTAVQIVKIVENTTAPLPVLPSPEIRLFRLRHLAGWFRQCDW